MAADPIQFTCPHCGKVYTPSPEEQFKSVSLEVFHFSVRSWNALANAEIKTVGDLIRRRPADLLRMKYFGWRNLLEIRRFLQTMNLALTGDDELSLTEPPAK